MSTPDNIQPDGPVISASSGPSINQDYSSSYSSPRAAYPPPIPYPPPLLIVENADTLVYIDPAPSASYSNTIRTIPHHIRSETLLDPGSPYLRKLFEPRLQARTIKRRNLDGKLPATIKYVIDLTPPSTDDEAVIFLTELSCPAGIRTWKQVDRLWNLPMSCVGGHDEEDSQNQSHNHDEAHADRNNTIQYPPGAVTPVVVGPSVPVEYSATRHRVGIELILHALQGDHPPAVDTPCKFWTFFSLARLYEIATVPKICDFILAWIYDTTNTRLIETQPEVAYRVACGTQCSQLCRDTFSILVGEEAIRLLTYSDDHTMVKRPRTTVHGRTREPLDDEEIQRVEYASKSFVEYVINHFIDLVNLEMTWLHELPAVQQILKYVPKDRKAQAIVYRLVSTLKDFVRGCIVLLLAERDFTLMRGNIPLRGDEYPCDRFVDAYRFMCPGERLMSRTFWTKLGREDFGEALTQVLEVRTVADLGHLPAFENQQGTEIKTISRSTLNDRVWEYNELFDIFRAYSGSIPSRLDGHATRFEAHDRDLEIARQKQALWNQEIMPWAQEAREAAMFDEEVPFKIYDFIDEVRNYVSSYAGKMLATRGDDGMRYEITDTLTCLTDAEFKFLPLWAGGNDDGSGGVFSDQDIPAMEAGFSRPGPRIHTGSDTASSGSTSVIGSSEFESTVQGASHRPTDGYFSSDVISMDSTIDWDPNEIQHGREVEMTDVGEDLSLVPDSASDEDDGLFDGGSSGSDSSATITMHPPSLSDGLSDFEGLTLTSDHMSFGDDITTRRTEDQALR
ncbi:hypothetical protein FE257_002741 [Aspergillus nanangensis]|uniref:Uncharacterized protein n=1 Tax=Aspergillus nanangensis TaxID=2582783 RepID=A0AAD4CCC7_ASPNN|nr:hypothetical protein FE257_002741 [Aspergillus nanangensis]